MTQQKPLRQDLDPTSYNVASLVRSVRSTLGLTQQEVADRAGLSAKHINQIESGRTTPTIRTLAQILNSLGLTLYMFATVGGEDNPVEEIYRKVLDDVEASL